MYPTNQTLLSQLQLVGHPLAGQTALITGAARGIGEATAYFLSCLGANIIIADILPRGQHVAEIIQAQGGKAGFIQVDVSSAEQVVELTTQAQALFGTVDILINGVMGVDVAPLVEVNVADWDRVLNTNLRSAFLTMHELLPGMLRRKRGVIVNVIAYEGSPSSAAYSASKMGMRSLALSASREVGPDAGVSIFSFVPGIVDTPGLRTLILPKMVERLGLTMEQVLSIVAQNPGYSGLVPVEDCAGALTYTIVHGSEYHGQVADPFEPLNRHGIIHLAPPESESSPVKLDTTESVIPLHLQQYLSEVTQRNRDLEKRIAIRTRELAEAHAQSESLLLNILPQPIAERLKHGESIISDHFNSVTVLFADIVDFTPLAARFTPERVVQILNVVFTAFDVVAHRHRLEKIKTVGDCYMMVGGLTEARDDHTDAVASAALDLQAALVEVSEELNVPLTVRIGVHTGAVVAGVIGRRKFIYDLWGDTVNTASRMESHSIADRIQCTREVYEQLHDRYVFEPRGEIEIKGKGSMQTYFLLEARRSGTP